jgi:histidyl-tRNA synthetase
MPEFSVGIDSLNTSDNVVTATWNGAEDQEVVDYVQALQDADFTYNVSESKSSTNYSFNAYNNESIEDTTIVNLRYTARRQIALRFYRFL